MSDSPNTEPSPEDLEAFQQELPLAWSSDTGQKPEADADVVENDDVVPVETTPKSSSPLLLKKSSEVSDAESPSSPLLLKKSSEVFDDDLVSGDYGSVETVEADMASIPQYDSMESSFDPPVETEQSLTLLDESYSGDVLAEELPPQPESFEENFASEKLAEPMGFTVDECASIGDYLVRVREARGMSRSKIVATTRIRPEYIEALESDDYDELPQRIYILQYLKKICSEYEIDHEDVIDRYKDENSDSSETKVKDYTQDDSLQLNSNMARYISYAIAGAVLVAVVVLSLGWLRNVGPLSLNPAEKKQLAADIEAVNGLDVDLRRFSATPPNLPLPVLEVPSTSPVTE